MAGPLHFQKLVDKIPSKRTRVTNSVPTLRDLERLPRDEVIRKRLHSDVSPILARLVEVEPLVSAQSERAKEAKSRLLEHNDKVRQESVDQAIRDKRKVIASTVYLSRGLSLHVCVDVLVTLCM